MSPTNLSAIDELDLTKPDAGLYESEFWAIDRHQLIAGVAEELLKPTTTEKIKISWSLSDL